MANRYQILAMTMIALFILLRLPVVNAQEEPQLRLVAIDTSTFPLVSITLLSADSHSAPADLSALALREDGVPITDLTFDRVAAGVDVTFVLDANMGFDEIDPGSSETRREKVLESIRRFSRQFMNPDGLDTVSIVVPDEDGQNGRFLLRNAAAADLIEEAVNDYSPQVLGSTPLNAMIDLALDQAQQRKDNGRYQAVLLFTDGRRLDQQLSFLQLVAQANDANVPIYSAILGESADPNEIANVSRLSDPTRAFFVHMPEPAATDPIYQIWQDQSSPVQVQYRSNQRQSGRNQLTLNLGSALISTSFDVTLAPPEVTLSLANTQIIRAGIASDTPLEALQPAIQPITITVAWPDGLPRKLTDVILLVDGESTQVPVAWRDLTQGQIELDWDIHSLDEGSFELIVQIVDELGYQGITKPVVVAVGIDRPLPPTPLPTAEPQAPAAQTSSALLVRWDLLAGAVLFLFLVLLLFLWQRRSKLAKQALAGNEGSDLEDPGLMETSGAVLSASLEPVLGAQGESFSIVGENTAVGSEAENAQIILQDSSVSRLHARIRRQEHDYWLFDEGGSEGTYLNYERLGLAPQKLSDGDTIQFGKVTYRFRLRQAEN